MTWSAQRSGGRPLGRRHDDDAVDAKMSMGPTQFSLRPLSTRRFPQLFDRHCISKSAIRDSLVTLS